jgi:hypothetical protein
MIVEIDLTGAQAALRLLEPDVFTSFKAVMHADGPPPTDRLVPLGVARVEEHVWIRIDTLRELAGDAATAEWEASLQGMIGYARSKGWVDEELAAVRAHVERA